MWATRPTCRNAAFDRKGMRHVDEEATMETIRDLTFPSS
jgi:hypothetical protein